MCDHTMVGITPCLRKHGFRKQFPWVMEKILRVTNDR